MQSGSDIFCSLVHSSDHCPSLGHTWPKQGLPCGGRVSSTWALFCCLPTSISREPNQKHSSWTQPGAAWGWLTPQAEDKPTAP